MKKLLPLFSILALTGCQTTYTRLTVTDFDGQPVSDWVAEGWVRRVEGGYMIRAVERRVEGPNPVYRRFPNGWRTTVVGANILQEKVEKPAWLAELDAGGTYTYEETLSTMTKIEPLK